MTKLISKSCYVQNYHRSYTLLKIKRFWIETLVIFLFQFLILFNLTSFQSQAPLYPALGLAFTLFYLLGNSAFYGLLLGGIAGYYAKDFALQSTILYLIADLGGGYLGAMLCQKILTRDLRPFENTTERLKFIGINALVIAPITCCFRMVSMLWNNNLFAQNNITLTKLKVLLNYSINVWLSDLNGILVFSGFMLSWVYVFYSREKVFPLPMIAFLITIFGTFILINPINLVFFLGFAMIVSMIWSVFFGYLVSTALMFILSIATLIIGMMPLQIDAQSQYFDLYLLVPVLLFLYIMIMLWLGHFNPKGKRFSCSEKL